MDQGKRIGAMSTAGENSSIMIPLLRTQDLCKDFPSKSFFGKTARAVDSVNLEIYPGEILGIVGESGSGKTTLARCCLRLLEPTSGSVYFDGQNLESIPSTLLRSKRQEFQMIFQDPHASLNPAMTVEEVLMEPLRIHKVGPPEIVDARVRELLDAVSLEVELLKRAPAALSGGQQQRVGIARGLVLKPRLLIADEPVSALDASVQAQILNLLADLKNRYDLTLMLISHSLYVINYLCDRISVMYRGRIVEEASTRSFFKKPKHPYSRMLLDSMPVLDPIQRNREFIRGRNAESPSIHGSCCAFHTVCPQAFALCREQIPDFREIGIGERIACFLYS